MEETILEAARHKMNLDKQVIQAGMFNTKSDVKQQKDFLLQVFEEEVRNLSVVLSHDPHGHEFIPADIESYARF